MDSTLIEEVCNVTTGSCNATSGVADFGTSLLMTFLSSFPLVSMFLGGNGGKDIGNGSSNLFTTGLLLLIANYSLGYVYDYLNWAFCWIWGKFYFSLVIKSEDEMYNWIFEYVNNAKFSKRANELSAHSAWNKNSSSIPWQPATNPFNDANSENKRPMQYFMPYFGTWFHWFSGYPLFIKRSQVKSNQPYHHNYYGNQQTSRLQIRQEVIRISTFGIFPQRTIKFLKSFVDVCMEKSYAKNEDKTFIYTPVVGYNMVWKRQQSKSVRTFESVVLDADLKERIKDDVELFQRSKKWYTRRGIPFRRGYLLHGPPGTGKTSYISALAGKLKMSIACLSLNLAMMDDAKIAKLIDDSPRNSLLVIEDVDVALVKKKKKKEHGIITLSGLLNALDGLSTAEGRILFMTTNHIDKLSTALLRPGRVDLKAKFGYASKSQIEQLWLNFYGVHDDEDEEMEPKKHERMVEIGKILREKIPEHYVTCAELQGLYLLHRFDEEGVLDDLDRFLEDIKKDREKQKKEEEEKKKKEQEEDDERKKELQKELEKLKKKVEEVSEE